MGQMTTGGLVAWLMMTALAFADDRPTASQAEDQPTSAKLPYLVGRWDGVTIDLAGSASPGKFEPVPIMQWQNPISGAEGAVFAWTSAGRPVVLCKCHVNDLKQHYVESSVSLARQPFVMKMKGQPIWSPKDAGVAMKPLTDVAPPADRDAARLVQMRAIARRFRMQSVWGEENSSQWELRLLSTPLVRYRSEPAGVIDGAIFGYAQGTNPEAVLVVEALQTSAGTEWQAAPSRLTGYAVKAWRDDELVLDVPAVRQTIRDGTYHHVYERPSPYPFLKKTE
jgi:hypothetical protein